MICRHLARRHLLTTVPFFRDSLTISERPHSSRDTARRGSLGHLILRPAADRARREQSVRRSDGHSVATPRDSTLIAGQLSAQRSPAAATANRVISYRAFHQQENM